VGAAVLVMRQQRPLLPGGLLEPAGPGGLQFREIPPPPRFPEGASDDFLASRAGGREREVVDVRHAAEWIEQGHELKLLIEDGPEAFFAFRPEADAADEQFIGDALLLARAALQLDDGGDIIDAVED